MRGMSGKASPQRETAGPVRPASLALTGG